MKNTIKRIITVGLAVVIAVSGGVVAFAAPADDADLNYLPLRWVFEGVGACVDWVDGQVTVAKDGDDWVFTPGKMTAQRNSADIPLSAPVAIADNTSFIALEDAIMLFGDVGAYPITIATAVLTTLGAMSETGVPGVTVAFVDAQTGFTWTQGFGYVDVANGIRTDEDSLFFVGSVSKPFTAIAIMQLVEEGIIGLDSPIVNYIPEFTMQPSPFFGGSSDDITVRMLLSHTGGIPSNNIRGFFTRGNDHYQGQMNDFLDWIADFELSFVPGTAYDYSNNSWTLLGVLAARMLGHDNYFYGFEQLAQDNILKPLGMNRSSFIHTSETTNVTQAHWSTEAQDEMQLVSSLSAGSLMSSASDMARFMHAVLGDGGGIINPETIAYMMQNHTGDMMSAPGAFYGLGFAQNTTAAGLVITGHNGGIPPFFFTDMPFNVDNGVGVFVSGNSFGAAMINSVISNSILEAALTEKLGYVPRAEVADLLVDPTAVPIDLTEAELADFIGEFGGIYDFGMFGVWYLGVEDGIVTFRAGDEVEKLTPMSDGSFYYGMGNYVFAQDEDGRLVAAFITPVGTFEGIRIEEGHEIPDMSHLAAPEGFEQWVGVYEYAPQFEGDAPTITQVEISINETGMAMLGVSQLAMTLMGVELPPEPLTFHEGRCFFAVTPLEFAIEDGQAIIRMMGGRFVRQ